MNIIQLNIDKSIFTSQWERNEWNPEDKVKDSNAKLRLEHHKQSNYSYDLVQLQQEDILTIIIPWHDHESIKVNRSGISMLNFGKKYINQVYDKSKVNCCLDRIRFLLKDFDTFPKEYDYVEGRFMYMANDPNLGIKGHYTRPGLYAGGFHQFAAYAVWIEKNSFKPLRLFLARE